MIDDFRLQLSQLLEGKKIEPADAKAFAKADRALNAVYRKKVKPFAEYEPGVPNDNPACQKQLRRAQRVWVAYRDAFRAAAPELAGKSSKRADIGLAVATELTQRRTSRLREDQF